MTHRNAPLAEVVASLLIDAQVKLSGDALEQAERSVIARLRFDHEGRLVSSLRDLVEDERAARPELFEYDRR